MNIEEIAESVRKKHPEAFVFDQKYHYDMYKRILVRSDGKQYVFVGRVGEPYDYDPVGWDEGETVKITDGFLSSKDYPENVLSFIIDTMSASDHEGKGVFFIDCKEEPMHD